jgi:energy-coupling factor transport system substrate-specific component
MFVLMRFVALPSGIPNTNLQLAPVVVSVFAAIFGPLAGMFIAFIGHAITDLTWGGIWWSWVIADAIFGLLVGLFWKFYKLEEGSFEIKNCIIFNAVQIAANLIAWVLIAPVLDILIYGEPSDKVFAQGLLAGALNAVVILVLGSILTFSYSKTRTKEGSLRAE